MRFFSNLREQIVAAAAKLAPDVFGAMPLYVLHFRELRIAAADLAGFFYRGADLMFKPQLQRLGRWQGRGACIILNTALLVRDVCQFPGPARWARSARRREIRSEYHAVALHELGHALDDGLRHELPRDEDTARAALRGLVLCYELNNGGGSLPETDKLYEAKKLPPWHGHELPFIRLALHLATRAQATGLDVPVDHVVQTARYGLSPTVQYVAALGREPERLAGCSIDKIKATPPPADFLALWQRDTAAWAAA